MSNSTRSGNHRRAKILKAINTFIDEHGYPPSIREICDATGISSTSVVDYHLDLLEEQEKIERTRGVSRGIKVL